MSAFYTDIVRKELISIFNEAYANGLKEIILNSAKLHKEIKNKYANFKNSQNYVSVSNVLYRLDKDNKNIELTKNTTAGKGGGIVTINCTLSDKIIFTKYKKIINTVPFDDDFTLPEEISSSIPCYEGAKKIVTVLSYERDRKARELCLKKYGYHCKICNFSSAKMYGARFEKKIHVHHIKPLSEIKESYEVNPETDLIPICPNCHMIIHSKGKNETYSVEEVKKMLKK